MNQKEHTAIATTLESDVLMGRATEVAGRDIGDPLHNNLDSVALREQFGLTIEYNYASVWAFNDRVSAAVPNMSPGLSAVSARQATLIAVAALWRKSEAAQP